MIIEHYGGDKALCDDLILKELLALINDHLDDLFHSPQKEPSSFIQWELKIRKSLQRNWLLDTLAVNKKGDLICKRCSQGLFSLTRLDKHYRVCPALKDTEEENNFNHLLNEWN